MLTVKHITEYGTENVYSVNRVTAYTVGGNGPESDCTKPGRHYHCVVLIFTDNSDTDLSENGDVYVMNDQGKTIATYHLPEPHLGVGIKQQSIHQG